MLYARKSRWSDMPEDTFPGSCYGNGDPLAKAKR